MAKKAENMNQNKITALYCRLSVEDIKDDKDKKRKGKEDESNSIRKCTDLKELTPELVNRLITKMCVFTQILFC